MEKNVALSAENNQMSLEMSLFESFQIQSAKINQIMGGERIIWKGYHNGEPACDIIDDAGGMHCTVHNDYTPGQ
jgi:hypothetical protein